MPVAQSAVGEGRDDRGDGPVDSYRRLADVFHLLLSEQSIDALFERIADALAEIVPYDTLTIYEADASSRILVPVIARDRWSAEILNSQTEFGRGLTGWAAENRQPVLVNEAHLDPRAENIPGTPIEPEALISIPLVAREEVRGALNIYRVGEDASFSLEDFELAQRFGDAAALGLANARTRAGLEHQAQTDSLTGLYNHRHFHERLRAELNRVSRTHDSVSLLMLDLDDFKRVNDVHGHSEGDRVLVTLADILRDSLRGSDLVCRIGGDEFAVIMPSCDAGDALGLAGRLAAKVGEAYLGSTGELTLSLGVAQAPQHAMNPRELVACAESAMMAAKARGKNRVVLYDDEATDRPDATSVRRDVRSIAHLKMLQSLSSKLNRLSEVAEIGALLANELRTLIDYHNCRVYVAEGDDLIPIAFRGELAAYHNEDSEDLTVKIGEGITGRVAETGRPLLLDNALDCDYAISVPGTDDIDESVAAVPLLYGGQVIGVIFISKLGAGQFDGDDLRLLEVLAGHAAVALENARLYELQRREAENAKALLEFADRAAQASSQNALADETVTMASRLLRVEQAALWLENESTGDYQCLAQCGYVGDPHLDAVVREPIPRAKGDEMLADRRIPFVLAPMSERLYFSTPVGTPARPLAIVPLAADGRKGWLVVRGPETGAKKFNDQALRVMAGLSYQASVAMQKADLYKAQKESAEIASALLEFSREFALAEGLDDALALVVELSGRILGSPQASIWMEELETGDVMCEAMWGYSEREGRKLAAVRYDKGLAARFLTRSEPFVMKTQDHDDIEVPFGYAEGLMFAVAPLDLDGGRLASLVVTAPALGDYTFSDRKMRLLAGIAHQAKLAITNAGSFENLERTFLSTVEALVNTLEANDEYTSSHARSITDMCLQIGERMGMGTRDLRRLELGALFHDIGKIGIPSKILGKPGPLTPEERQIIQTHPEVGERILAPIDRLDDVRPIVRHCHEHFDGGGYPDGKTGEEIPVEARIILVCDAFHAMTTDRPYRDRLSLDEACTRLRAAAGRQFDPAIVDLFLELLGFEEFRSIAVTHSPR